MIRDTGERERGAHRDTEGGWAGFTHTTGPSQGSPAPDKRQQILDKFFSPAMFRKFFSPPKCCHIRPACLRADHRADHHGGLSLQSSAPATPTGVSAMARSNLRLALASTSSSGSLSSSLWRRAASRSSRAAQT